MNNFESHIYKVLELKTIIIIIYLFWAAQENECIQVKSYNLDSERCMAKACACLCC